MASLSHARPKNATSYSMLDRARLQRILRLRGKLGFWTGARSGSTPGLDAEGYATAKGDSLAMAVPHVTLHFAQSLDGRIGLGPERERALLSSEEGVLRAHRARAEHDAVLVGIRTALHDDPLLTARGTSGPQPLRVVLDSSLRLPPVARLLHADGGGQVIVFGSTARAPADRRVALEKVGAEVCLTSGDRAGRVMLGEALELLAARGVKRLLVEGGAQVLTSFLGARLALSAEIELSPLWLGAPATPVLGELNVAELGQALRLERIEVERLGQSVLVRGDVVYPAQGPR
jgi:riboflavin-specific deaminase-like protein